MKDVPGQTGLDFNQLHQRARFGYFGQKPWAAHVEQLCFYRENLSVEAVLAQNHVIDVHLFSDAIDSGA